MKKSTKIGIGGFLLFFIGSLIVQLYIEPLLYTGLMMLYIAWMLIDAKLNEVIHEGHVEELNRLRESIDKSLEGMKNFVNSDQTKEDEDEYFNSKKSEIDKDK